MSFDTQVKLAIYGAIAESGIVPALEDVAGRLHARPEEVRSAYARLEQSRLLLLESDRTTIRMAPPFSGVPTQHRVRSGGIEYFANCAWDAFGIPAALHRPGDVLSRCEGSGEPLRVRVGRDGPPPSSWYFHCLVPAAAWWKDLVFT